MKTVRIAELTFERLENITRNPCTSTDDTIRRLIDFWEKHKDKNDLWI